jgi:hypothetical protein
MQCRERRGKIALKRGKEAGRRRLPRNQHIVTTRACLRRGN